jgi:hypothetical protein
MQVRLTALGAASVVVSGIEIAFDAYRRKTCTDPGALSKLCAHMLKGMCAPLANPRFMKGGKGTTQRFPDSESTAARLFAEGCVGYLGNKDDPHTQRIYLKTTDRNGKDKLTQKFHRARFENTYLTPNTEVVTTGSLLDIIGDQDFAFRKGAPTGSHVADLVTLRVVMLGARRARKTALGPRLFGPCTEADGELNSRAHDALRRLAKTWAAPPKTENLVYATGLG